MKLFADQELTKEVPPETIIDWGIVPAGETREYTFYLQNDTISKVVEIQVELPHKELFILQSPMELNPYDHGELRIQWKCAVDIKQGLKTPLAIAFKEIYS